MPSKKEATAEKKPARKPRNQNTHTAEEKCRAVLSVWSERRKVAEICREMSITWVLFNQWQRRAIEGMLQALEPRTNLDRGAALSPRLQNLLEKNKKRQEEKKIHSAAERLGERLSRIQETTPSDSSPPGEE